MTTEVVTDSSGIDRKTSRQKYTQHFSILPKGEIKQLFPPTVNNAMSFS